MRTTKGKHGGARSNSRIKAKTADPVVLATWKSSLSRAICVSATNMFVLRKDSFFTVAEIKESFGKRGLADFKEWFVASKHFDQNIGDKLYQERASGKIDEIKFKKLFYTTAFYWVWSVKSEKHSDAWRISRGLSTLEGSV